VVTARKGAGGKAAGAKNKVDPAAGPDLVQLLTPEGDLVEHPDYKIDLSPEEYRGLYRDMVLVRRVDAEGTALQRQGELGLWAPLLGQEAAQVGSGRAQTAEDYSFPTYREHGVAWCRGVDPVNLLGMFRGVNNGGWDPNEKNFHLYTIVIGSQTFCQNNQWAISEPNERQFRVPLYKRAAGYGFPGIRVDGNDVLAVLAVTRAALEHARSGNGPMLVEAFTYRMGAHTTSDDPTRYRSSEELEEWKAKDPILRMRTFLEKNKYADEAFFKEVDDEADIVAADIRARCIAMPDPKPVTIFDHVYAEPHPLMDEERAEYGAYWESFEGAH
jgi:pyruvate dehydrogenase E1 component alpha subunit